MILILHGAYKNLRSKVLLTLVCLAPFPRDLNFLPPFMQAYVSLQYLISSLSALFTFPYAAPMDLES